jgi:hypothetical protein
VEAEAPSPLPRRRHSEAIPKGFGTRNRAFRDLVEAFGEECVIDMGDAVEREQWLAQTKRGRA